MCRQKNDDIKRRRFRNVQGETPQGDSGVHGEDRDSGKGRVGAAHVEEELPRRRELPHRDRRSGALLQHGRHGGRGEKAKDSDPQGHLHGERLDLLRFRRAEEHGEARARRADRDDHGGRPPQGVGRRREGDGVPRGRSAGAEAQGLRQHGLLGRGYDAERGGRSPFSAASAALPGRSSSGSWGPIR
jgi:hypothetical protein